MGACYYFTLFHVVVRLYVTLLNMLRTNSLNSVRYLGDTCIGTYVSHIAYLSFPTLIHFSTTFCRSSNVSEKPSPVVPLTLRQKETKEVNTLRKVSHVVSEYNQYKTLFHRVTDLTKRALCLK